MGLHELFGGKPEVDLKELFEMYNSTPNSPRKKILGRIISARKKKYVDTRNHVGIVHISRYLSDYEKDRLFIALLEENSASSLFVLAFADSEMHSYEQAYRIETEDLDNDEEALKKDIELTFDDTLCKFLAEHDTKDDLEYVHTLLDGATWLEAYKRASAKLSQLWNL